MTLLHNWQTAPTDDHPLVRLGRLLQNAGYQFTTISPPSHRRVNAREHHATAGDLRGVFGWNRPFEAALVGTEMLQLMDSAGILRVDGTLYRSGLRVSTLGGELYFHSAYPTHDVDSVFFGPDTYRYEQVIDSALAAGLPVARAVDIGSGAGPGAIKVARAHPQADVWAVDVNPAALALTALNAQLARRDNIQLAHSDVLTAVAGQFDLIVANPPFMVDDDQRTYCHGGGALGEGLSHAIVDSAIERLAPGGRLVLYTCVAIIDGADPFCQQAGARLDAAGMQWQYRELDPDVFGGELGDDIHRNTDRIAAIALVATRSKF
ncbi:methylase of polypeptide subunit release factors [Duganella sp. 3397]|uniref:methyltransferase n=1 Tax=Duganella sp. 3397 TaxID=2817732 RepID=UPI0028610573|nr:methyltransferase [Duganella sp. 3397]MDR7048958.1 methylase of polypeptide subunit release factors [Duganella sp. 3397]